MTGEVAQLVETMSLLDALCFSRSRHVLLSSEWYNNVLTKLQHRLLGEMRHQSKVYSWVRSSNAAKEISEGGVEAVLAKTPLYVTEDAMKNQHLDLVIIETILGASNVNFVLQDVEAVVENIVKLLVDNWRPRADAMENDFVCGSDVWRKNFLASQELTKRVLNRGKL